MATSLSADTFWLIAMHGEEAGYVRNIRANPDVRVRLRDRWVDGTASVLPAAFPVPPAVGWYPRLGLRLLAVAPRVVRIDLHSRES